MEVILQENVSNLGFVGDVVKVKPGYARNFLLPKKLALPATRQLVKLFEHKKKQLEVKKSAKKTEAEELKKRLEAVSLAVEHLAGEGGRIFGSVTVAELQEQLSAKGFDVQRSLIQTAAPIRTAGEYKVEVKLYRDVSAFVSLVVTAKVELVPEEEKSAKAEKKAKKQRKKAEAEAVAAEAPKSAE